MNNHLFSLVVVPASESKALLTHGGIVFLTNNHPLGKIKCYNLPSLTNKYTRSLAYELKGLKVRRCYIDRRFNLKYLPTIKNRLMFTTFLSSPPFFFLPISWLYFPFIGKETKKKGKYLLKRLFGRLNDKKYRSPNPNLAHSTSW